MESETVFSFRNEKIYYHHTVTPRPEASDLSFLSHAHSQIEFYYFIGGSAQFSIEGNIIPLSPGMLLIIDRNVTHNLLIRDESVPYERTAILIDPALFPAHYEALGSILSGDHLCCRPDRAATDWIGYSMRLVEQADLGADGQASLIMSLLSMLMAEVSRSPVSSIRAAPNGDELVLSVIRYINDHLTDDWCLDDLQRELYRDKAYLNRHFHRFMGCSIWKYLNRKRVLNARQQLAFSGDIDYAFAHSGFNDYSTFYRNYRALTGMSPSEDLKRRMK